MRLPWEPAAAVHVIVGNAHGVQLARAEPEWEVPPERLFRVDPRPGLLPFRQNFNEAGHSRLDPAIGSGTCRPEYNSAPPPRSSSPPSRSYIRSPSNRTMVCCGGSPSVQRSRSFHQVVTTATWRSSARISNSTSESGRWTRVSPDHQPSRRSSVIRSSDSTIRTVAPLYATIAFRRGRYSGPRSISQRYDPAGTVIFAVPSQTKWSRQNGNPCSSGLTAFPSSSKR